MAILSFFTNRSNTFQYAHLSTLLVKKFQKKNTFFLFFMLSLFLLLPLKAFAANPATSPPMWKNILGTHQALPPHMILVDKDKQHLAVYKGSKSYSLAQSYACTTGKRIGNKEVQGDLKTPEGIYFIVRHISSGLDFVKYGDEAYTLNYPNPVDRLYKKTGYGIWIHGRGEKITPLLTEGCVALNNEHLKTLGSLLTPGTPVALTNSFAQTPKKLPQDDSTATLLVQQVEEWAKAWGNRSTQLFQFYNADAYSIANEPFNQFKNQKERLFKQLPWIKTTVHNVQALKGPDYWVTWFFQNYEAPNLTSNGIRRLYWQQNNQGKYVIVGMEWVPGLTTDTYIADVDPSPLTGTDTLSEPLGTHMFVNETVNTAEIAETSKEKLAQPLLALALYEKNILQPETTTLLAMNTAPVSKVVPTKPQTLTALEQNLPPPLAAQRLTQEHAQPILMAMGSGNRASDQGGIIPADNATQGEEATPEVQTPLTSDETTSDQQTPTQENGAQEKTPTEKGRTKKVLEQNIAETDINVEEQLHISIVETINEWALAWEEGDLEWYMEYYTKDAVQGKLTSAKAIYSQKQLLWKRAAPAKVTLSNFTITINDEFAEVSMHQRYTSKNGNNDQGLKTLKLKRIGDMWFIADEQWRAL